MPSLGVSSLDLKAAERRPPFLGMVDRRGAVAAAWIVRALDIAIPSDCRLIPRPRAYRNSLLKNRILTTMCVMRAWTISRATGFVTEPNCAISGRSARYFFPAHKARNPLKSLDTDERIQGNPRQSKPQIQGKTSRRKRNLRPAKIFQIANRPLVACRLPSASCPSGPGQGRALRGEARPHRCRARSPARHATGPESGRWPALRTP